MEFPVWYVPYLTAPMLIPLSAVPHVIVAQFAVGAGIAGAAYAVTVLQSVPGIPFFAAGASLITGVLLAASYWKSPGRAKGGALILAQFSLLVSNAGARQWVQFNELMKWYNLNTASIRGEWGSFGLFMILLVIALILIAWIGLTALRRTRNNAQNQFTN